MGNAVGSPIDKSSPLLSTSDVKPVLILCISSLSDEPPKKQERTSIYTEEFSFGPKLKKQHLLLKRKMYTEQPFKEYEDLFKCSSCESKEYVHVDGTSFGTKDNTFLEPMFTCRSPVHDVELLKSGFKLHPQFGNFLYVDPNLPTSDNQFVSLIQLRDVQYCLIRFCDVGTIISIALSCHLALSSLEFAIKHAHKLRTLPLFYPNADSPTCVQVDIYPPPRELKNSHAINPHDIKFRCTHNYLLKQIGINLDHSFTICPLPPNVKIRGEQGRTLQFEGKHLAGFYITDLITYYFDDTNSRVYLRVVSRTDTTSQLYFYKFPKEVKPNLDDDI